jgi:hypothetical protein
VLTELKVIEGLQVIEDQVVQQVQHQMIRDLKDLQILDQKVLKVLKVQEDLLDTQDHRVLQVKLVLKVVLVQQGPKDLKGIKVIHLIKDQEVPKVEVDLRVLEDRTVTQDLQDLEGVMQFKRIFIVMLLICYVLN